MIKPEYKLMRAIFGEPVDERDDLYYEEVNGVSLHDALMEAMDSLQYSPSLVGPASRRRYKRVILLRFGFESSDGMGKTLEQVAMEFDVTRERIRQIEAKALRLLRHPSRARKLKLYFRDEKTG